MPEKLRIAQLVGNAELGGVANCVLNYYRAIDRERFQFDFLTYGESSVDEKVRALGGEVYYLPSFRSFPSACRELDKLLKEKSYDIFHSHLTSLSVFPLYIAKKAGISTRVCHSHSTTDNKEATAVVKNVLKKFSVKYATDLFACGRYSAEWMFGQREAFILHNAIDLERFSFKPAARERLRAEYGIKGICMGFAGRFEYQKNLFYFLDVAKEAQKSFECTAVLAGGGSKEEALRAYAAENGIEVVFVPNTPAIEEWYSAFDCLVMPSKYEGLPLVGVEAQAAGLKCLFSDAVTAETDCGSAEFLPTNDVSLWAERIACNGDSRYDNRATLIEKGFDITTQARVLEKKYEELASRYE